MTGLVSAMGNGRANVQKLDGAGYLRHQVEDLLNLRQTRFANCGFYAATPHAERLIGAAMILDPTIRTDGTGDTMILGVNIASGTQIARAATRLRDSGNHGVLVGIVLNALIDDWHFTRDNWTVAEVDELLILGSCESSGLGELAQRSECGVSLTLS